MSEETGDSPIEAARARRVARIGQRIRELRRDRMTLAQLAETSGVSIGLLSRLENGVGNPSFVALGAIARALGVDISAFFQSKRNDRVVDTNSRRITFRRTEPFGEVSVELLAPSLTSAIVATLVTLPPAFHPEEMFTAEPGEQYEFIVAGNVRYHIDHEVHDIETGDFILFDAGRPHRRQNLSDSSDARILSCATTARLDTFFPPA